MAIDFDHIAKLARLGLSEKEREKLFQDLTQILEYINQLKEVPTDDVEPTSHTSGSKNIFRDDEEERFDQETVAKMIAAAPNQEKGFIKVKKIFD